MKRNNWFRAQFALTFRSEDHQKMVKFKSASNKTKTPEFRASSIMPTHKNTRKYHNDMKIYFKIWK
jgi:hypothetical protein